MPCDPRHRTEILDLAWDLIGLPAAGGFAAVTSTAPRERTCDLPAKKFSANRVLAFTFLTPLFGVAAGYLVLGEPLTPAFARRRCAGKAGLVLVNRTK